MSISGKLAYHMLKLMTTIIPSMKTDYADIDAALEKAKKTNEKNKYVFPKDRKALYKEISVRRWSGRVKSVWQDPMEMRQAWMYGAGIINRINKEGGTVGMPRLFIGNSPAGVPDTGEDWKGMESKRCFYEAIRLVNEV